MCCCCSLFSLLHWGFRRASGPLFRRASRGQRCVQVAFLWGFNDVESIPNRLGSAPLSLRHCLPGYYSSIWGVLFGLAGFLIKADKDLSPILGAVLPLFQPELLVSHHMGLVWMCLHELARKERDNEFSWWSEWIKRSSSLDFHWSCFGVDWLRCIQNVCMWRLNKDVWDKTMCTIRGPDWSCKPLNATYLKAESSLK